jgi:hypothetical protein
MVEIFTCINIRDGKANSHLLNVLVIHDIHKSKQFSSHNLLYLVCQERKGNARSGTNKQKT